MPVSDHVWEYEAGAESPHLPERGLGLRRSLAHPGDKETVLFDASPFLATFTIAA
jgi:hypothetical protein